MTQKHQIQLFEDRKVRSVWDDEEGKWYFSILDVVQVLTDSVDVKQYIKRMRSRDPELNLRWGTICTPTRMMATDGKYYKTQAASIEGIFRLIQSIPSPKAEPFKLWMASVASRRIDQMQDPELNNIELALNTLAEASTTEISKARNPKGFKQSAEVAKQGGEIAGDARKKLEEKIGRSVISLSKSSDYLPSPKETKQIKASGESGNT